MKFYYYYQNGLVEIPVTWLHVQSASGVNYFIYLISNCAASTRIPHQLFWLSFAVTDICWARRSGGGAGVQIPDSDPSAKTESSRDPLSRRERDGERGFSLGTRSIGEPTRTNFTLSLNLIFFRGTRGYNVAATKLSSKKGENSVVKIPCTFSLI